MNFMDSKLGRRSVVAGLAAAVAVAGVPAMALNKDEARVLVGNLVGEINAVINSGQSESEMFVSFEKIFAKYADVSTIARYTLGADARRASPAQMQAFTNAFRGYIGRRYGRRFREFIGGEIEVVDSKKVKSFYEVKTRAKLNGKAPFFMTFQVTDRSGSDKFFNLMIEGVNLLLTERSEIGALLDQRKGNLDQLIRDLKSLG